MENGGRDPLARGWALTWNQQLSSLPQRAPLGCGLWGSGLRYLPSPWSCGLWFPVLKSVPSQGVPSLAAIYQGTFDRKRPDRSSVPSHPPGRAAPKPCPPAFTRSSAGSLVASLPGLGPGQEVPPSDPTSPRAAVHVLLQCRERTAGLSGGGRDHFPRSSTCVPVPITLICQEKRKFTS